MAAGEIARGVVNAWVRVLVKATLTLFFLGFALAWLLLLAPAYGILGAWGAAAWLVVTAIFVGLMRREMRMRRRDWGTY
jgi:membrane-bound ClpP family serine protease